MMGEQLLELIDRQKTASRSYQFLGVAHFVLISVGVTGKGLQNGASWLMSGGVGLAMGLLFLLTFAHLAGYHGNGPGDGRLVASGPRD